jgi:hypothetical protein
VAGGECMKRTIMIVMHHVKVDVTGENSSTYWEKKKTYKISVGKSEEINYLKDLDGDGRIILKWIFKNWDRVMACIHLAQDRNRWHVRVNAVMNVRVS